MKTIASLLLLNVLLSAEVFPPVNTRSYEFREITNFEAEDYYNDTSSIEIKGYMKLASGVDFTLWKPVTTWGIWEGCNQYITIDSSVEIFYSPSSEAFESKEMPDDLCKVSHKKGYHFIEYDSDSLSIGTFAPTGDMNESSVTNWVLPIFGLYENWNDMQNPVYDYFPFPNNREVFYLKKSGQNSVKFQIVYGEGSGMKLLFATDSVGNGYFRQFAEPVVTKTSKVQQHNISFIGNQLHFPNTLIGETLEVVDMLGKVIVETEIRTVSLSMPELSTGTYVYCIGSSMYGRFIVE